MRYGGTKKEKRSEPPPRLLRCGYDRPRFKVCVLYGETAGPFSEQSKPARTSERTPPLPLATAPEGSAGTHAVTLRFRAPHDDGVSTAA